MKSWFWGKILPKIQNLHKLLCSGISSNTKKNSAAIPFDHSCHIYLLFFVLIVHFVSVLRAFLVLFSYVKSGILPYSGHNEACLGEYVHANSSTMNIYS